MTHPNRFLILAAAAILICASSAWPSDSFDSKTQDLLASRGLIGGAIGDPRAPERIPEPAAGASVTELVATLAKDGEEAAHAKLWSEAIAGRKVDFMLTTAPTGQTLAQYWVMRDGGGCDRYGATVYSKHGHLVTQALWRNDPEALRVPGSPQFPPDMFPNVGLPIGAFFESLRGGPREGAAGRIDMQTSPYDFIELDTWVDGFEKIDLPAGSFETVKIEMRPNLDTILRNWPKIFRKLALPFTPSDYFYFNRNPPHQLIKFEGTIGYPAPRLNSHMLRTYVAEIGPAPARNGESLDDALAARGLIGGGMGDSRAPRGMPDPAKGTVVDEIGLTLSSTHEPMSQARIWHEPLGDYILEIQEGTMATGQSGLSYWLLPRSGSGCVLAAVANWSRDGRLISSDLWRNDSATLRIPGAMDFPHDLYSNISLPIDSPMRAVEAAHGDGTGKINLQVSPYSYITLDAWRIGSEEVATGTGSMAAQEIAVRPDLASILPSWPSALRAMAKPFFPKMILDYADTPPRDLIQFHGTLGWPAPQIDLRLNRRYIAGAPTQSAAR